MRITQLSRQIALKKTCLTIGLDTDLDRIPIFLKKEKDPIFTFNKAIIDATRDVCVSYKLNTAFYEAHGLYGWDSMAKTVDYIGSSHFIIADAKRGDIGNTSAKYAEAFFKNMSFDAVTVTPYMGSDSIQPFLNYRDKVVIVLGLTSNIGSQDFQRLQVGTKPLYVEVMQKVSTWGNAENIMFVVGATHIVDLIHLRSLFSDHYFLVPGVGTQGGQIKDVCQAGLNKNGNGLLINNARSIIYASGERDFDQKAYEVALQNKLEMAQYLT